MTRIDFYLLPDNAGADGGVVMATCRLCDKATGAGKRVYVATGSPALADELDGALWSFRQGGFVTHERFGGGALSDPQPAVLIGSGEPPESHHDVLINLDADVPDYFSRFERVLEIVSADPAERTASRTRYRFYRDRGYELNTFEQGSSGGWTQRKT